MIVSDTTRFPGRLARNTAAEFKTTFGKTHSLLYGVETRWLGGTKNRQAALAHDMGSARFIHLEMNQEFRPPTCQPKKVCGSSFLTALLLPQIPISIRSADGR